jgi:hypothetical protein
MNRDQGLRRASVITGALVAASLTGTLVVAVAAHAADSSATSGSSESTPGASTTDAPSLSAGGDGSGQATSGGS